MKLYLYKRALKNLENIKVKHLGANHVIINTPRGQLFQSYDSTIAIIKDSVVYLDSETWNYSRTTERYRNMFLNEGNQDTRDKIQSGEYKLTKLN